MPFTDGKVTGHDAQSYTNDPINPPAPQPFDEGIAEFLASYVKVWDDISAAQKSDVPETRDAAFRRLGLLQTEVNSISQTIATAVKPARRLA